MPLLPSIPSWRRAGIFLTALSWFCLMEPAVAGYREQRVQTALGTYVLRSDADDNKYLEDWSSSVSAYGADGRELLFQEPGLVVGCWEFSPGAVEVTGRSGTRVRVVLLCGSPGGSGRNETLVAIRDGTAEIDQLSVGNDAATPLPTSDGRLIVNGLYRQDVPGISSLMWVPMQFELNVDAKPIRFESTRGGFVDPSIRLTLKEMRQTLSSSEDAQAYFASAHAVLGARACAHLHSDLPTLWKLLGDPELAALNRWVASRFSLEECSRHEIHH